MIEILDFLKELDGLSILIVVGIVSGLGAIFLERYVSSHILGNNKEIEKIFKDDDSPLK